jgi:hypothetical protein
VTAGYETPIPFPLLSSSSRPKNTLNETKSWFCNSGVGSGGMCVVCGVVSGAWWCFIRVGKEGNSLSSLMLLSGLKPSLYSSSSARTCAFKD